eukprot:TRINITY_DN368_c0_g3_i1.p1 TRINITY_DN368_c0_g3~~TRINITY_DN368_c0_g3_i1.p1  ORF type:complete len:668 (-),score=141.00 TRINITY_DN368_c0_g3_i1:219-2222(-)
MKCYQRRPQTALKLPSQSHMLSHPHKPPTPSKLHFNKYQKKNSNGRLSLKVSADVNWDAFGANSLQLGNGAKVDQDSSLIQKVFQYDFVVIGSGIAGLTYALKVAKYGSVAVLAKEVIDEGSTKYAQGGVCSVLHPLDSVAAHTEDTIVAGAFLNDEQVVKMVCQEGPARVLELAEMGAAFTREADGKLHLTKEGGHSHRRIVHAADMTGKAIQSALVNTVKTHANIDVFEHHFAKDLVVDEVAGQSHCFGVDVINKDERKLVRFVSPVTMLATGGVGQIYPHTTNPSVCSGDGIAMAFRANAKVANMEFVQFHPTSLYNPEDKGSSFLITEAVRGEGGLLFDVNGNRFMPEYDPRLELAPRDVVARAIHSQIQETENPFVLLDISHKPADKIKGHFPTIYKKCLNLGIDITKDPIPVVPAMHYLCGGVVSGMQGETGVQGLFACGEVACTGLHGANRLASNSLLEGLVFADRAVEPSVAHLEYALKNCSTNFHYAAAAANTLVDRNVKEMSAELGSWVGQKKDMLRSTLWDNCGIVRSQKDMRSGLSQLAGIYMETKMISDVYGVNLDLVELLNMVTVGELICASGLVRKESRGLHFCTDFPELVEQEKHATVTSWPSLKSQFQELNRNSVRKKREMGRLQNMDAIVKNEESKEKSKKFQMAAHKM